MVAAKPIMLILSQFYRSMANKKNKQGVFLVTTNKIKIYWSLLQAS
jgi:hypothetical protein